MRIKDIKNEVVKRELISRSIDANEGVIGIIQMLLEMAGDCIGCEEYDIADEHIADVKALVAEL